MFVKFFPHNDNCFNDGDEENNAEEEAWRINDTDVINEN